MEEGAKGGGKDITYVVGSGGDVGAGGMGEDGGGGGVGEEGGVPEGGVPEESLSFRLRKKTRENARPISKRMYMGRAMIMRFNGSPVGVKTEEMMRIKTKACRRYCARSSGGAIPKTPSKKITKGV